MDFRGADVNNVLKFFSVAAGWQIVPDPGLTGPVTIISPRQLTVDQAFEVLQSVLQIRGFSGQLEKRGTVTVLKIVPLDRAVTSTTILRNGNSAQRGDLMGQVITQVIPVDNVDAAALARELRDLVNKGASIVASTGTNALIVTDTSTNVDRIAALVEMLDRTASSNKTEMFRLQHADATEVANVLNNLFRQVSSRGRPGQQGQQGQPGQPGFVPQPQPGQPGQQQPAVQERSAIVAVADTRTNSVFVVASEDNMTRVREIIKQLDDPVNTALNTKIIKMKYADAVEVADTINSVLSSGSTTPGRARGGGQGASFQQRVFGGGGFGGFGGFGGGFGGGQPQGQTVQSTDPFAKVVANQRTNSLIATATEEKMKVIEALVAELDVPVPVESTTFVVPLKNAQAEDLAYTLGQAFGTGQGTGFGGFGGFGGFNPFGFGGNQGAQRRQPIQRRQGQQNQRRSPGRSADLSDAGIPPGGVTGTLTPTGFVPDGLQSADDDPTRQFFFGGGGGLRAGQMQTPLFGRGTTGGFVNLLQLRQNVGVVPEIGSNSLIITTTPDNMRALREIIEALDIVPRQVMIEVIIAEATLDVQQKLGFQFDARGVATLPGHKFNQSGSSSFPLGTAGSTSANIATPINPGAQYGLQALSGRFNALVQALATDNKVKIIATPKVFTSNNQQATINITTNVPIIRSLSTNVLGASTNYEELPVGIELFVTPRITQDGIVSIDVLASQTDLVGFDTIQTGVDASGRSQSVQAPRTTERSTDTSVSVKDGEIVVLGGLMREGQTRTVNKVPLLGDIPLLGHLFRSTTTRTDKTELMIFLIPHVVDGVAQNRAMVDEHSKGITNAIPQLKQQQPQLDPDKRPPLPGPDRFGPREPAPDRGGEPAPAGPERREPQPGPDPAPSGP